MQTTSFPTANAFRSAVTEGQKNDKSDESREWNMDGTVLF